MSPARERTSTRPARMGSAPALAAQHPLREFAVLGDGERGVVVGPHGEVAWMCFPGWSDEAVFAGLLGAGGVFRVGPAEPFVTGGYYEERSLIWHSRFVTHRGIFESRDALAYPGSPDRAILLRQLKGCDQSGEMVVQFAPARDYGRRALRGWKRSGHVFVLRDGGLTIRLQIPEDARLSSRGTSDGEVAFRVAASPERTQDVVVEFLAGDVPDELPDPATCWSATALAWRSAVPDTSGLFAGADVGRSLAVLRGLTDHHGATVAAATTSLPERDDADRNYDYRFSWIRDSCYVGQAGAAVPGAEGILVDAVRWVTERLCADGDRTSPAYLPNGDPIFPTSRLGLPGYPGGTDVVGNHVREQFQLDLFGDALLLFAKAAQRGCLEPSGWQAATIALEAIERRWDEPEAGIWELGNERWTESRLMCVAGLRAMASVDAPVDWAARALSLGDHILDRTNVTSLHASGRWQRAPEDDRVDAALLLGEIRGALSPSDPRSVATRAAVMQDLSKHHYVWRYRHHGHELGESEGSFLICNFWMSLAALGAGAPLDAVRWFERGRSAMSTSGLFSEEFDVAERQLRGNLPQAFVHAMFVEAAAAQGPA